MIAAAKRLVPWLHGLLAYLAWRAGGLAWGRRARHLGQVNGPVCVIQVNSHGDVLMATPLLQALVGALGAGRVDVVVSTHTAPLLKCFPGLGKLIVMKSHLRWRRPTTLWGLVRVVRELRNRRYGAILDVSRLTQSAWMTFLARPQRGVGLRLLRRMGPVVVEQLGYLYTDEVEVRPDAHMIRQNLALLTPLGITASSERVRFTPDPSDVEAATGWLTERELGHGRPFVVIHPGAKWPPKRWHAERFRVLTGRLLSHGLAVVLAGDAADRPLLDAVAGEGTPSPLLFILAGDLQFSAVGALLREARLFIGNDSGLMHLAEAVGTPIVALFGPTFPDRTGPLGPTHRALVKPIPCRPCRLYFTRDRCERGHNYCMDMIDVDEVWASTHALLDQETKSCPA
jgi:predicted lipopolysaccharide heptosyltransferase III